ncbi:hypothetical protein ACG2LH_00810 [Zhouia sp. PK063]|uniref:hypothetical protein n=1 Tax=Zhouia sp. PK063 TaxID=3373602 RepID=UPI0037A6E8A2
MKTTCIFLILIGVLWCYSCTPDQEKVSLLYEHHADHTTADTTDDTTVRPDNERD